MKVVSVKALMKKLVRDERGVSALEYAILAAAIVGIVVVALSVFGPKLKTSFDTLANKVTVDADGKVNQAAAQ